MSDQTRSEEDLEKPLLSRIIWRNAAILSTIHIFAVYGLFLSFTSAKWQTVLWFHAYGIVGAFGVTLGAHRLWSHRAYKAKLPFRILLMIANSIAFQNPIIDWAKDHRVHHKWSDTDADPHNIHRGFFFAHMGWLMLRKHPEVIRRGRTLDFSDLLSDPVLLFQKKHFLKLCVPLSLVIPSGVPVWGWEEDWMTGVMAAGFLRWVISLHLVWWLNSVAHTFGYKPYDASITPTENYLVILTSFGEGYHNYHHTFPWDYRGSEYPMLFNAGTVILDFFAWLGMVYDRRRASNDAIQRVKTKQLLKQS